MRPSRVSHCSVSIWWSDIFLVFILRLERSEFSLKGWQAEQSKFPRDFSVLAALQEPSLQGSRRREPSGAAVTCQDTEPPHRSLGTNRREAPEQREGTAGEPTGAGPTVPGGSAVCPAVPPPERHPQQRRRPGGTVLCPQHSARSLRMPAGKSHQASGTGDYSTSSPD